MRRRIFEKYLVCGGQLYSRGYHVEMMIYKKLSYTIVRKEGFMQLGVQHTRRTKLGIDMGVMFGVVQSRLDDSHNLLRRRAKPVRYQVSLVLSGTDRTVNPAFLDLKCCD
jgi:hypothetical protein